MLAKDIHRIDLTQGQIHRQLMSPRSIQAVGVGVAQVNVGHHRPLLMSLDGMKVVGRVVFRITGSRPAGVKGLYRLLEIQQRHMTIELVTAYLLAPGEQMLVGGKRVQSSFQVLLIQDPRTQ